MQMKSFFQIFISLSFLAIPLLSTAQVEVNEQSNVGIKTSNIPTNISLKIENQSNYKNLNSVYNYAGTEFNPMHAHFESTINSDNLFRGLYGTTLNEGNGLAYNFYGQIVSASSGQVIGFYNKVLGFQAAQPGGGLSTKYGIYNNVEGLQSGSDSDEGRTGVYNIVRGNGNGALFGLNNYITGNGNGGRLGIHNAINGTGSGDRRGIMNYVYGFVDGPYTSGNTKYGLLNYVFGAEPGTDSDDDRIGLYNRVYGDGNGNFQGLSNRIYGDGSGYKYGILNSVNGNGDGEKIGLYNLMSGANDGIKKGIQNLVKGTGGGTKYGLYNYVFENGTGAYYGVYNYVFGDNGTNTKYGVYTRVKTENSTNAYALYSRIEGGGYAGYFIGDVHVVGNLTSNPSDRRLKNDIVPFGNTLDKLMALKPVTFNYKTDRIPLPKEKQLGLIAQEVEEVFPDAVREASFVIPSSTPPDTTGVAEDLETEIYKVIDYDKLIPVLIKSIQEQQVEIEALKAKVKTLEEKNK